MLRSSLESFLAGDHDEEGREIDTEAERDGVEGETLDTGAPEVGTKRTLRPDPIRVRLPVGERASGVAGGYAAIVALAAGRSLVRPQRPLPAWHLASTHTERRAGGGARETQAGALACGQQHARTTTPASGAWGRLSSSATAAGEPSQAAGDHLTLESGRAMRSLADSSTRYSCSV